jgi:PAS domain S-box-containing protein
MFADTIVLIDANAEKRGAISQILRNGGFNVQEIETTVAALDFCRNSVFSVVVASVRNAGDVGDETLRRIKSDFLLNQILILQISPEELLRTETSFENESTADMIIAEPFNHYNLISALRTLIRFQKQQETHNQQNTMLQLSLEPIFVWDFERGVIHWNKGCERLYGFTISDALGKNSFDLLQTDLPESREAFLENLKTNGVWNGEIERVAKDGKRVTVETQMRVTEFGRRSLVLEVNRDVTESRRAATALQERERLLSSITDTTPSLIYIYELNEGRSVFANGQIRQILGFEGEEFHLNRNVFIREMCHPEDADAISAHTQRLKTTENGNVFHYEYRLRHKNGEYRWLRSRETIFSRDENQKPLLVLGVAEDVTEQKIAAQQLSNAEERYRAFIAQSGEGIWRFELDEPIETTLPVEEQLKLAYQRGYLAECNDAMARMYGFATSSELTGARIADLFANDSANEDYLRAFLNSGYRLLEAESHERDALGNDVYFLNNLVGIVENNRLVRVWGTQRDITESKSLERQINAQNKILEAVALGKPLEEILRLVTESIERQLPGSVSSVLLANDEGTRLFYGSAEGLPAAYNQAIDGIAIGENVGSCGTAAFRREQVIVADIYADSLWRDFRDLAMTHNLRACWSHPIISPSGKLLGTFATYFRETRAPREKELAALESAARAAGIAIERKSVENQMRQSEERYRLAVHTAALGTWDYNFVTDKLIWSETHYAIFGYDLILGDEPSVEKFELCVHPDDLPKLRAEVEKAKQERRQFSYEYRIFRRDTGELRWLSAQGQFFYDATTDEAQRFIGALIDITERKENEERIKRANERFRIAEEASNGFLYDWNAITNHVERSAAFTKVLGYTTEEVNTQATDWKNLIHPADRAQAAEAFWKAVETGKNFSVEYRVRHKDGHYVDVLDKGLVIRNETGKTVRVVGTTVDISEIKGAQIALREIEERFRLLTENLDDVFWIFNWREKHVEYVSPAFAKKLGFECENIFHSYKNWSEIIHPDDRHKAEISLLAIEKTGKYDAEYRVQLPNGETRWLHDKGSPIRGEKGEITWIVGVAEDITERKKIETDLEESRQHLQLSTDAAQLAPWRWDVAGDKVFLSAMHENLWGMNEPQFVVEFKDWEARIHPDDFQRAVSTVEKARAARARYESEYRVIPQNADADAVRWIRSVGQFVFNEAGEAVEMYGVDYDITNRKEAENALRHSQLHMKLSTEAARIGTWQWMIGENKVFWSPLHKELWGFEQTPDPITYEDWRAYIHPDDIQMVETEIEIALRDGSLYDIEYRIYPAGEAEIRWIRSTGQVIYNDQKEPLQFLGISTDISRQKSNEAEILRLNQNMQERVEELQKLFDLLPVGVAIANSTDLRHISANKYLTETLGLPNDSNISASNEEISKSYGWRFFSEDKEFFENDLPVQQAILKRQMVEEFEFDVKMPHKETVTFVSNAAPLLDENGNVRGAIGAYLNVTERRKTEREREEALERERQARAEAELANRSKDEFLAVLSHELRTPLNSMFGWVRMLSAGNLDAEKSRRAIEVIERNIILQTKLIEDILDVSRIISGKIRLETRELDFLPLILSAIENARPTAETKNVTLDTEINSDGCVLEGDGERLQQIVSNLLSNAIKFTPSGGRITIGLTCNEQIAELTVADNGVGIEAEFLPYVFDRFRQADSTSKRKHGGLGLGLAIVKHLAELHGGQVSADSAGAGLGATFYVRLPMKSRLPLADENEISEAAENHQAQDFGGANLLVVDDDRDALEMLRVMLSAQGAKVNIANSAIEALKLLKEKQPDVLISDIGMPEMSGIEFIKKLRRSQNLAKRKLPAIALTAYASAEDRERILAAGFDKYQTKPIVFAELLTNLKDLLKRAADLKKS